MERSRSGSGDHPAWQPIGLAAAGWGITMAGWIISPYITKLLNKAKSHVEVDINIRELETHLIPRLKFTLEAAEGSKNKETLGKLVSRLKSAFHVTEEILDELEYIRHHNEARQRKKMATQGKRKSPKCGLLSFNTSRCKLSVSSKNNKFPPHLKVDLKKSIKNIEGLIEEACITLSIGKDLLGGGGSAEHGSNATTGNREKECARPIGKVTGRDGVRDHIMRMLESDGNPSSSDTCLSVIGIHGIPGSGKTTLARYIFHEEKSSGYFDLVMWVHVSEKFRVDTIFMEMIEQSSEENIACPHFNSLDALATKLEKLLGNKRFLLVLDDVWCSKQGNSYKKLSDLLPPLMMAKRGSKILVTGRIEDAVCELGTEVRIIDNSKIPELDDKVFLELFMHHAFGHKERYQPLVMVGIRIAQKLKKSPLLAKAVGGVLYKKQDLRCWKKFEEQKIWGKYMGPLWWCYQHLDEQSKQCFAYCSIFPRGRHLYCHELVNLWVAEGFICSTDGGWNMECVSQDCFDELLSVSFLQPGGKGRKGKEYFVIHDLLYDLAEIVAGSSCFKVEDALTKAPSDVRHLSIKRCSATMITEDIMKLKNLRTLVIFYGENDVNEEVLDKMFMELSKLRVLIFETVGVKRRSLSIPGSINYLKHLRYLSFHIHYIETLFFPGTIAELYLLQVFECEFGSGANLKFPTCLDVTSLTNLRHVVSSYPVGEIGLPFRNIGMLTSLQTMPHLYVSRHQGYELHQLGDLNNLQGELTIMGLDNVDSKEEALRAKLADKRGVTSLLLGWNITSLDYQEIHTDVLEGLYPPEGLEYMSITDYRGLRYPEWMFGPKESKLQVHRLRLRLCDKLVPAPTPELYFVGVTSLMLHFCKWDAMPYNMVQLTELEISSIPDALPGNMDQLHSLKRLIIRHCRSLIWIPALPTSLQYLELVDCDDKFTMSCKDKDHPNYMAIDHIPEKKIVDSFLYKEQERQLMEKRIHTPYLHRVDNMRSS